MYYQNDIVGEDDRKTKASANERWFAGGLP